MLASMLSMVSTLAKAFKPKTADGEKGQGSGNEGNRAEEVGPETPKQPSPLQQALGFDPKILTMLLNIIASMDFMKQRNGDGRASEPKGGEPRFAEQVTVEPKAIEPKTIEAKVSAARPVEHKAGERKPPETDPPKAPEQKVPERKPAEEKALESRAAEPKVLGRTAIAPKPEKALDDTPKDPLVQLIRKRPATRKTYHKPGLGIYRGWPGSPVVQ